jgi:hypothetical protein
MAPINVDVAEVEAQISAIRRRRNSLAVQRALAAGLSAALLGGSVVVGAALRGSSGPFAIAVVLTAAGTVACIGYMVRHTWRDWLSLPAAAQLADTRAALKDRLTTLLAVAPISPVPPLRPLLLDQVLQARQHWGVETLAPRRVSPWLALVPLAAAVFIATTFYARPAAVGTAHRFAALAGAPSVAPLGGSPLAPDSSPELRPDGDGAAAAHQPVDAARRAAHATSSADPTSPPAGAGAAAPTGQVPLADAETGANLAGGALDQLRQSLRRTFGAPAAETSGPSGERGGGMAKLAGRGAAQDQPLQPTSPTSQGGEAQQGPAPAPAGDQRPDPANRLAPGARDSKGNGRGGTGGGGTSGLLGAAAPAEGGSPAPPMAIKLNAIVGVSPAQTEPQRRHDVPAGAIANRPPGGSLPPLAEEQLADATVQPLNVGPEHEGLIRRIFTRE